MEELKKPYECRFRDCSMSFVTKDHLDVHVRKHDLSLTLTPSTPFKTFVDETPTPTRFLKELESEVFQDLNGCNPFDATFRRANSSNSGSNVFLIPESSSLISSLPDTEVLNTPSITIPESPILLKTNFTKKKTQLKVTTAYSDNNDTLPFTTDDDRTAVEESSLQQNVVQNDMQATPQELSVETSTFLSSESAFLDDMQGDVLKTSMPSVQTPVITSIGQSSVLKTSTTGVPTAVVVSRPSVNPAQNLAPTISVISEKTSQEKVEQPQAVVQSVCVTPMMQVIIRLPDGQTMPIQFPVMSAVPTITGTQVPSNTPIPTATPVVHSTQPTVQEPQMPASTTTKMKLKEVITLNQKSSSQGKGRSKTLDIQPLLQEDMLAEFGLSPPSSPIVQSPGHNGRKRREHSDNPDEKRKRSLERNRAAATRCREKKKSLDHCFRAESRRIRKCQRQLTT